jgi:hypothetical protein
LEYNETRHTTIHDLGGIQQTEKPFESLTGIYEIESLFRWKTIYLTAQGLLEIAAYVEQYRDRLEQEAINSTPSLPTDRYYVQRLTPTEYRVRERMKEGLNGPHDPSVEVFKNRRNEASIYYTAYSFAGRMNEQQRELDERYGHWVRHAITSEIVQNEHGSYRLTYFNKGEANDFDPFRGLE